MPLESTDPGYKNWLLAKRGYDTNAYQMDDNGNISSKESSVQPFKSITQEPVAQESPISTKPTTSGVGSFMGHAANSLLPTAGGLGGAALGTALAPETGGLSFLIPLLSGLGAGAGTSALQSSMQSDATKQSLADESSQHPILSKLGDLAPSALAFNPVAGIKGLVSSPIEGDSGILQNIPKLLGANPNALTATERGALANAGINAGIQGGINAGQQLVGGQPFNYGDLAADTVAGGVMNQPYGLGKLLFPQLAQGALPDSTQQIGNPDVNAVTTKSPIPISAYGGVAPEDSDVVNVKRPNPKKGIRGNAMYDYMENPSLEPQLNTLEGEGGPVNTTDTDTGSVTQRMSDYQNALNEQRSQDYKQAKRQRYSVPELKLPPLESVATSNPVSQNTLKITQGKLLPQDFQPNDYNNVKVNDLSNERIEDSNADVASGSDLEERRVEGNKGDKFQEELQPDEQQFGLFKQSDPRYVEAVAGLAKKRGISLLQANDIISNNGIKARGSMNQSTRTAKYDPNIATEDTIPHEVGGHGFVDDLLSSKIPSDQKLAQRALNIYGDKTTADESVAESLGKKLVPDIKTTAYGTKADQKKLWMRDFISRWKNTLGVASDEDVMNHLSRRFITDAPRGSRGEIGGEVGAINTSVKNQEEYNLKKSANDVSDIEKVLKESNPIVSINNDGDYQRELGKSYDTNSKNFKALKEKYPEPRYRVEQHSGSMYVYDDKAAYNRLSKEGMFDREDKGSAARLSELTNKDSNTLTPEEISERDALQKKSDSLKGQWKFQEEEKPSTKMRDGVIVPEKINFGSTHEANPSRRYDVETGNSPLINFADEWQTNSSKLHAKVVNAGIEKGMTHDDAIKFADSIVDKNAKYQEGTLGRPKQESTKDKESSLPFSSLPGFRSVADTIQAKDGPRSLPALKAAGDYLNQKDSESNKWIGMKNDAVKGLSSEEKNLIEQKGIQGVQEGRDTAGELPAKLQEPMRKIKAIYGQQQDEAIAANQPVDRNGVMSPRKKDPNFWAQQLDPNQITMMKGNSAEGDSLRNIWDKYNQSNGMTKEQSKVRIDNMLVPENTSKPDLSHFRGLDVAQGIGLPKELQRPGFDRNFERYSNRFASGRAFHDNIESKGDIASLFNIKKDPWGKPIENPQEPLRSPEAANLLSSLRGNDFNPHEGTIKGLESVATAGMLGPPTSMHIAVSSLITALNDAMPGEQFKLLQKGFSDIGSSLKRTYATGLNRYKPKLMRDFLDAHSTTSEKLNSLRDVISTINGREGLSKYTNAVVQNMGEYLVGSRIPLANMGNKQAVRFMQNLDPTWSVGKTYNSKEQLQLAANYAQQVHGAHDFRSMPQWMLTDNIVHPFVSLMSWNIAQTNRFFKSTITPAVKEGNYAPLITATLGASIGGYILKEAREAINNKKSPIPSLQELAASSKGIEGNLPLVAYNFAAMASYAGYAGILSTIARDAMDVAYKNPAQGSVFPLDEVLSNSTKTISQSVSALANSQPNEYFDIGTKAVGDLLRENIQIARMAASWGDQSGVFGAVRQDKKSLNTAEGDLRRYKMAEGMPVDDEGSIDQSNPYLNMARKNFQKTQDIGDAASQIPSLISQAFTQSNGNMEVLRNKLRALKDESYPSMPSPEHTPMTFWRYVEYLKNTQGDAVANQRVQDYFMHNAINKAKSSMVPSI